MKSNVRPDVTTVYRDADGKITSIHFDEVLSPGQKPDYNLQQLNQIVNGKTGNVWVESSRRQVYSMPVAGI